MPPKYNGAEIYTSTKWNSPSKAQVPQNSGGVVK